MKLRTGLNRTAALALGTLLSINIAFVTAYAAGLRINATASMPEGIYRLHAYTSGPIERGTVVAICPSAALVTISAPRHYLGAGPCPGNVEPLLKHVAGIAGDVVAVSDRALSVNGRSLPSSGRLPRDCAGRPLARIPAGRYFVAPDAVWLYAPVARSWDSRYFGAQPASGIIGIATPVLIVGNGRTCASPNGR